MKSIKAGSAVAFTFAVIFSTAAYGSTKTKNLRKHISLEELVLGAIKDSSTAQKIKLEALSGQIRTLRNETPLDLNVYSSISNTSSEAESISTTAAESSNTSAITIGASKYFSSGTSIQGTVTAADSAFTYPSPIGKTETGSSKVSLTLKQNLLSDSFGAATRQNLASSSEFESAIEFAVKDSLEDYALKVSDIYFNTQKAQYRTEAAKKNESEQKRLYKIAKILHRRGNIERSDLLQIESSNLNATEELYNSETALNNIWNTAITFLGLSHDYKQVDAKEIKLTLKDRSIIANIICEEPKRVDLASSNKYKNIEKMYTSSINSLSAKKDLALPKLTLEFTYAADNFEEDQSDALNDSLGFENPTSTVVLNFSSSIGNSMNKANLFESAKSHAAAKISFDNFKSERLTEIENECSTYERNVERTKNLGKIYNLHSKKAKLDMNRFELGRLDAFTAIQSTIAKNSAWLGYESSKLDIQSSAWKIMYLSGELEKTLIPAK